MATFLDRFLEKLKLSMSNNLLHRFLGYTQHGMAKEAD